MWLDALGKWSMIDIFVLVLSMVGFHLKILSPALAMLPAEFYNIEVQVIPVWGLYANLIAQLVSQVVSHIAIYYHRNVIAHAEVQTGLKLLSNSDAKKGKGTGAAGAPNARTGGHLKVLSGIEEGVDLTDTSEARRSDLSANASVSSTTNVVNPIHEGQRKTTNHTHHQRPTVTDYSNYGRLNKQARKLASTHGGSATDGSVAKGLVSSRIAHWEADPKTRKDVQPPGFPLKTMCQDRARLLRTIKQRCARMCTRWLQVQLPDQAYACVSRSHLVGRWL